MLVELLEAAGEAVAVAEGQFITLGAKILI
jgi:hypothetical protein